ncbi:MAG: Mbeg1-like protein, partial [Pseudomonadales bacterium]
MLRLDTLRTTTDEPQAINRTFAHYVINTDGPLDDTEATDDIAFARRYSSQLLQVTPSDELLNSWSVTQPLNCKSSANCRLRSIGQTINKLRYGRDDVIPSSLFTFDPALSTHHPANAMWMADMAELVYHDWSCDSSVEDRLIDPTGMVCVEPQLQSWGYSAQWIQKSNVSAFIASKDDHTIIAFRGTDDLPDVITDLSVRFVQREFYKGKVHRGFDGDLAQVWNDLAEHIVQLPDSQRIILVGHSLGAALAQLAAYRIEAELGYEVKGIYAYGSPRIGNKQFAKHYG